MIKKITNINKQVDLVYLSLTGNEIETLSTGVDDSIDSLDKLEVLKLNNNKIKVVEGVKNLDALKHLNLSTFIAM